jgi:hypothetical protein
MKLGGREDHGQRMSCRTVIRVYLMPLQNIRGYLQVGDDSKSLFYANGSKSSRGLSSSS